MPYRIAMFSDTHLGYAARCRSHVASGLNMRVRDGFLGLRDTVDAILAEGDIDMVLHGGDLFHRSHPDIASIAFARQQLRRLTDAGLPFVLNTGNHDFANDRGKVPATQAVDDPAAGLHAVTAPYEILTPTTGVNIHVVSHLGLVAAERSMPEPVSGEVNVFLSHGAAQVPGHEIFACVDSPGEAVIGYDVLTMPWNITLLGHYHGMGALPGFDKAPTGQAWYAGSLLRRGFSDPAGGRGWLLVTVNDDGTVTVEPRYVRQRDQHDLAVIDATGLTGAEVEEIVRAHLADIDIPESIIRQRVINCPLAVRRGVDTAALTERTSDALVWQLEFLRPASPEFAEATEADAAVESLRTAGAADLPAMWEEWFPGYSDRAALPAAVTEQVAEHGAAYIAEVSRTAETGADAADTGSQP